MTDYRAKFSLKGKRTVVVGGAGLIGREVARAFAQAGAKVVVADKDFSAAQKVCAAGRGRMRPAYLDLQDLENLKINVRQVTRKLGGVDVWVNCAYPRTEDWGAGPDEITPASWQKNVDGQMNAVALSAIQAAEMMKKKGGSIILLGSIYGVVGGSFSIYKGTKVKPFSAIYSAVKGGIVNFSRYLAAYYGPQGIRVNAVCSGGVFARQDKKFIRNYSQRAALGRMAKPEEVAAPILFLASPAAAYITGATVMVDGGWTAV